MTKFWAQKLAETPLLTNIFLLSVLSGIAYFSSYTTKFFNHFPLWSYPLIILDILKLCYDIMIFIRVAMVNCFNVALAGILFTSYSTQLNDVLQKLIQTRFNQRLKVKTGFKMNICQLNFFLHEHTKICYYLQQSNQELWSRFLVIFVPLQTLTMIFLSLGWKHLYFK